MKLDFHMHVTIVGVSYGSKKFTSLALISSYQRTTDVKVLSMIIVGHFQWKITYPILSYPIVDLWHLQ